MNHQIECVFAFYFISLFNCSGSGSRSVLAPSQPIQDTPDSIQSILNQKCGIFSESGVAAVDIVEIVPKKSYDISRNLSGFGKSLVMI